MGFPKPYYKSDVAALYIGDSLEIAPQFPKGYFDLIVTDPPYGQKWRSGLRDAPFDVMPGDDNQLVGLSVIKLSLASLKTNRHIYIFGPFDLSDLPLGDSTEIIWDKGQVGPGDLSSPWGPQHEVIQFAMYVPSKKNQKDGYGRLSARLRKGSIISVPRKNSRGAKRHPTEKPVPLLRQLIESSSVYNEIVFDPFAGSGSTLVAAVQEGRRTVGIEIDENMADTISERLEKARERLTGADKE